MIPWKLRTLALSTTGGVKCSLGTRIRPRPLISGSHLLRLDCIKCVPDLKDEQSQIQSRDCGIR